MFTKSVALLLCALGTAAHAETVMLPGTGGDFTISGMPLNNFSFDAYFTDTVTFSNYTEATNSLTSSFWINASIGHFAMEGCGANAGDAHCGRYMEHTNGTSVLGFNDGVDPVSYHYSGTVSLFGADVTLQSFNMFVTIPDDWTLTFVNRDQEQVAAVPELSSWAMMLLGFGGLGVLANLNKRRMKHASTKLQVGC